jgi:hypothetical protein
MSIFKNSFTTEISGSLNNRQNAISKEPRSPQIIQYLNTRNAWIRMSSSVNVNNDDGALAKKYILQGGITEDRNNLRSGVGGDNSAYSNVSPNGQTYQRGIRPMPGINSIDVKSKSAYGSLREVVVNFQCWDIKQLEDLELLYMRPGYTALIEWGWLPYLKNENNLQYNISPYDILNQTPTKEKIWSDIYAIANNTGGNYEAMFGYIKNYSWSARPDGGYDCTTTIISTGEIIESLKINYSPLNLPISKGKTGLFGGILNEENEKRYKKNILAGIFSELYGSVISQQYTLSNTALPNQNTPSSNTTSTTPGSQTVDNGQQINVLGYNFFKRTTTITSNQPSIAPDNLVSAGAESTQLYISLESLVDILNTKVLLKDKSGDSPFVKLSIKGREYEKEENNNLLCLAHPLQLSTDPTICLIGNDAWSKIQTPTNLIDKGNDVFDEDFYLRYTDQPVDFSNLINILRGRGDRKEEKKTALINALKGDSRLIRELNRQWAISPNALVESTNGGVFRVTLYRYLSEFGYVFSEDELKNIFGVNLPTIKVSESETEEFKKAKELARTAKIEFEKKKIELTQQNNKIANSKAGSQYLKNLESYFYDKDPYTELGIIGKIYINLQFLYSLSLDNNVESQDKKEKQEISLYDFIKNILSQVSNCIGNVNNFDIHVDPIDNVARIIDINYVDLTSKDSAYNNAFTIEMHNLKSTVRSYKLESQIFPEQSTIVAVASQVKGGALGTGGDTMVDFNKNISDRIIPAKIDPNINEDANAAELEQLNNLKENLRTIYSFLGDTNAFYPFTPLANFDTNNASTYKIALRDLISYFKSIGNSPSKNRAIIPTKLSIELDGIGGLIIGHIFKIPDDLLPRGYKGSGIGSKQGYIITGLGHKLSNGDWVTEIGAQTIILDKPTGINIDYKTLLQNAVAALLSGNVNEAAEISRGSSRSNSINQNDLKTTINFFLSRGYKDFQVAALVGGFATESQLNPNATNPNPGNAYGIAQWLGERKQVLLSKPNPSSLITQLNYVIEEFNLGEAAARRKLKNSTNLQTAIAAAAAYERFEGITVRDGVTYEEVERASGEKGRIRYAQDILERIKSGEFNN